MFEVAWRIGISSILRCRHLAIFLRMVSSSCMARTALLGGDGSSCKLAFPLCSRIERSTNAVQH
jgi:hypothetical protein